MGRFWPTGLQCAALPTHLVLTALRYEALAIERRVRRAELTPAALDVRVIGPGGIGLERVRIPDGCAGIIMAGLGGGLDPALATGDVVIDERSDLPVPEGSWRRGRIHTTSEIIPSVPAKQAAFAATGALVVDMENELARAFAISQGIPFLGVRAVSDRACDELDVATLRWIDPAGELLPGRVAADVLLRPWTAPALWRLGRRSRVAVRNLADAVTRFVTPTAPAAHETRRSPPCGSTA